MPELPEVETIVRRLRSYLIDQKIEAVQVVTPKILRIPPRRFVEALTGSIIRKIRRKGKMILIDLDSGSTVALHLKMTGQLLMDPQVIPGDPHTHLVFHLSPQGSQMRYRDVRKFGFFDLLSGHPGETPACPIQVGPDPFEISFKRFYSFLNSRKRAIKSLLLDQSVISGLGNIYVDESLFQSRIHPLIKAGDLSEDQARVLFRNIKQILSRAIRLQGSTLKDYRKPDGKSGRFQNCFQVYGRTGEPCRACGSPIQKIRVGGRGTHYCAVCQKVFGPVSLKT